jgi:hypothetical protein
MSQAAVFARAVWAQWTVTAAAMLIVAVCSVGQSVDSETVEIVGNGAAAVTKDMAAAEEEAIWDAKRNAVEQAAGIFLRARAVGRDFQLDEDEIEGRTSGFIRKWELIPESRKIEPLGSGRVLRVQVRATVALLPVIRKLSDIRDVYEDLERPRVRVQISGDIERRAADSLAAALKSEGFELTRDERAEILLNGKLTVIPTLRLGDSKTPYGVGEKLAACRARLSVQVISTASEEVLLALSAHGSGRSFSSDLEARADSVESAVDNLIVQSHSMIRENLLVKWARERQEGHAVSVTASSMDAASRDLLRQQLAAMRGFRRFISDGIERGKYTVRLLTRLDTRGLRRRLAEIKLNNRALVVSNQRGSNLVCALSPAQKLTGR